VGWGKGVHIEHMGQMIFIQNLGWICKEKMSLQRPRYRWDDNIKIHLTEIGYENME
jgi:hypothetical protein